MKEDRSLDSFRNGTVIYGDDFTQAEIDEWFADEAEGCAEIVPEEHRKNFNEYEAITEATLYHYFRRLERKNWNVLVYGGGYGTEILPILDLVSDITVLEPGEKFQANQIGGKPCRYIKPTSSGKMIFEDESFDCIICLGVLHHVPNVSYILREFFRVLRKDGVVMIREPITSMHAFDGILRPRMTKRERGLLLAPFRKAIQDAGLTIQRETLYGFGPLGFIRGRMGLADTAWSIRLDIALSKMFLWNYSYDSGPNKMLWKKFRPTTAAFFIEKQKTPM